MPLRSHRPGFSGFSRETEDLIRHVAQSAEDLTGQSLFGHETAIAVPVIEVDVGTCAIQPRLEFRILQRGAVRHPDAVNGLELERQIFGLGIGHAGTGWTSFSDDFPYA